MSTTTITATQTPTITPTPLPPLTPVATIVASDDVVNILLVGLDTFHNLRSQHTDAIIVASINKSTKQIGLLSVPRDLWVYIPTYGWNRVNRAHRHGYLIDYPGGGQALLTRTIETNLGIPIDHWVRIEYDGFIRVVDALGGVDMLVACPVNLRYQAPLPDDPNQEEWILEPGEHHLDGYTALHYVRTRRWGDDFDRAQRQQQFLKALWNQTRTPETIAKIPALWSAMSGSFDTDMSLVDVLALAPVAVEVKPHRVRARQIGYRETSNLVTPDGWKVLLPDYAKIQQLVDGLFLPPSYSQDQVAEKKARIQVRNGTYRWQLAKIAADKLRWQGLHVVDTGLADHPNYEQTQIIAFTDQPETLEILARALRVKPENIFVQPDPSQPADLLVILGDDYDPCR